MKASFQKNYNNLQTSSTAIWKWRADLFTLKDITKVTRLSYIFRYLGLCHSGYKLVLYKQKKQKQKLLHCLFKQPATNRDFFPQPFQVKCKFWYVNQFNKFIEEKLTGSKLCSCDEGRKCNYRLKGKRKDTGSKFSSSSKKNETAFPIFIHSRTTNHDFDFSWVKNRLLELEQVALWYRNL